MKKAARIVGFGLLWIVGLMVATAMADHYGGAVWVAIAVFIGIWLFDRRIDALEASLHELHEKVQALRQNSE